MLKRLLIRDFVLTDSLELEFEPGFSVLTGETGAGKSILIDALTFVLGGRSDPTLIRAGCERAEVSAEFDLTDAPEAADWLCQRDLDASESLLLRRVLDAGGRSRAYLNGSSVTLQQLKEVTEPLVDIHGQHAHQSLLREEAQRQILDARSGLDALAKRVAAAWRAWREADEKLNRAKENAAALEDERSLLEWRRQALESLAFSPEEWSELNVEHTRLAHAANLLEGARFALLTLAEETPSCDTQLDAVLHRLDSLVDFDPQLAEIAALLHSIRADLSESTTLLRRYADRVDLDPRRLEEAERRIDAVMTLSRKFKVPPENLPELLEHCRQRLDALTADSDIAALESQEKTARDNYQTLAEQLSAQRGKAAKSFGEEVSRVMRQLALGQGRFEAALVPLDTGSAQGLEKIEFRLAGLSGDLSRPLSKVASGGELSRISLAIQVIASQAARVPTLIFDEVDAGIGGSVAEIVGRLLRELSQARQILCVTHLPQVASRANWQWQVVKTGEGGAIRSRVERLDKNARIEEIARMLGGIEITPITRKHAKEMLDRA